MHDLSKMIAVFEEKFAKIKLREIERGTTMFGPHRDDLDIYCQWEGCSNIWITRPAKDNSTFSEIGRNRTDLF